VQVQVIVVAGPSGAGKSRLCTRLALPTVNLDDFYRDGDDPSLPCLELTGGEPIVDWDDPASWNAAHAVATLQELCTTGAAELPTYDISTSRRTGTQELRLDGRGLVVAEGIFAQEIVAECRRLGMLADAVCVTQHPLVTFVRRLSRDLREHRKPPWVLLRRGVHLTRAQRAVVARAVALGCRVVDGDSAYRELSALAATAG
jgi:uridine kinase